jgi:hypothetical protein
VRVTIYSIIRSDCSTGLLPSIRLAVAPGHGTVTVKRATLKATILKQCLAVEAPAFVAFYHADRNFDGADRSELEIDFSKSTSRFFTSVSPRVRLAAKESERHCGCGPTRRRHLRD